ncbi:hypothetical protein DH2020_043206 [Rehmannia glutinosa]|uniref:Transmembrane protein n=1 Tax=Rehmannia glutinosa TaxID=99300 RepID=A0ABR0UK94_REHGL
MEEEYYSSSFPMAKPTKIMRTSIFLFLQNFQHFTSTPTLLAVPFAVSTLLSQPLIASSPLFPLVHGRLRSLLAAAGFPPSLELFAILNLKLSQTILSFLFALPFTLSFLLLSKASTITTLFHKNAIFSWISIHNPLLITQCCNSIVVLSANATCFCVLLIFFNCYDLLGLSSPRTLLLLFATGAIIYSIVLANAYVVCNLSLIVSGIEKRGGANAILKACLLVRGRTATALSLAVPMNMALAAVEALFQYRVVRAYNREMAIDCYIVLEAMLVAYMYSALIVLDTIVGSVFLKSCKTDFYHQIEIQERDYEKCLLGKEKKLELVM